MEITLAMQGYGELKDELKRLLRNVSNQSPFFTEAKVIMFSDIQRHFQNEESPDGKWEPIKYRKGEILQDTGRLRASIAAISSNKGAEVGTNMIYAPTHQFGYGKKNIPQRIFIWLSDEAETRIIERAVHYYWIN
jgi:phage gpG-like protein